MLRLSSLLPLLLVALLAGCQSMPEYRETGTDSVDLRNGAAGLPRIAVEMTETMLATPRVQRLVRIEQPVIFIDNLTNKTAQHIDTQPIVDAIGSSISDGGQFQPKSGASFGGSYQSHSGRIDPSKAIRFGRQVGAQFMLYGQLTTLSVPGSSNGDFYQLTLRLLDLETGLIEWSGQKELRQR